MRSLFAETPEVADDGHTDRSIAEIGSDITCKNLHFRYADGLPEVFSGFNAEIPAGATIGVLGRTGCGKSTLVSLLTRLYNVGPGQIYIGGQDIRSIPIGVLREHIACVPQENLLFSDTIQANIAFGTRTIDKMPPLEEKKLKVFIRGAEAAEEWVEREMSQRESETDQYWNDLEPVMQAAKDADVHDNIMEFPHQYATVVGERGVTLSGGQKQRICIARALLRKPKILILDDSTSAVDSETELRIRNNLNAWLHDTTVLIITQRIYTMQSANRVILLDDGEVESIGTPEELLERSEMYREIYHSQQIVI